MNPAVIRERLKRMRASQVRLIRDGCGGEKAAGSIARYIVKLRAQLKEAEKKGKV